MKQRHFPDLAVVLAVVGILCCTANNATMADERAGQGAAENGSGQPKIEFSAIAAERDAVERELASSESGKFSRADLLVMLGRSAAASGSFRVSCAAYAMFLEEFGPDHAYAEQIYARFVDSLAPLDLKSAQVSHTAAGPRYRPVWRMGAAIDNEQLRQAVAVCEYVAERAEQAQVKGAVLFRLGWIQRVLNDWEESTRAWERCATVVAGTRLASDATWLAVENLVWADRPAEAADQLRRFMRAYPNDSRMRSVPDRLEMLEAESRRAADFSSDPVAHLQKEIAARAGQRYPHEVYTSVVRWLQRNGERGSILDVSRWACGQTDWPLNERISCRYHLVDALLLEPAEDSASRSQAADELQAIVDLAPDDSVAVPAAIRLYRLLNVLGRTGEADEAFHEIATRVKGSRRWEPVVLMERIESLIERGDKDNARATLDILAESHPDYDVHERFDEALAITNGGE